MNARYRYLEDLNHAVMSPSGKYVGGFITGLEGENDFTFTAVIIDLESDERVEIGPYPESLMGLEEAEVMTDQGTLYISDYVNGGCVAFELDGTYYPAGGRSGRDTVRRSCRAFPPTVPFSSVMLRATPLRDVCMLLSSMWMVWERRFHCLKRVFAMRSGGPA